MNTEELLAKSIGEIAGKIIEKSVDLGSKFIGWFFRNHKEKVKENAEKNAMEYLNILAEKIKYLDESAKDLESKNKIDKVLESPDFSKILEQSIKIASLTDEVEKKDVLASLIVHRLLSDTDTTEALIVKIACEKIEYLNSNHLKLLGLIYAIRQTAIDLGYDNPKRPKSDEQLLKELLVKRFFPYSNVECTQLELEHIEFHNCLKMMYSVQTFLGPKILPWEIYTHENLLHRSFLATVLGNKIMIDWTQNQLQHAMLSLVGNLIGQYVYEIKAKI
jgi:hypothetical protein